MPSEVTTGVLLVFVLAALLGVALAFPMRDRMLPPRAVLPALAISAGIAVAVGWSLDEQAGLLWLSGLLGFATAHAVALTILQRGSAKTGR